MRDAVFGRQRYWGEPIPIYYKDGIAYPVDEKDLPVILPEVDKYLPTEDGEPPLARATNWKYSQTPEDTSLRQRLCQVGQARHGITCAMKMQRMIKRLYPKRLLIIGRMLIYI